MNRIFITGATGNVGKAVVQHLLQLTNDQLIAGVRNPGKASMQFPIANNLFYQSFDFENFPPNSEVFADIDIIFLLRPPHLSAVDQYFKPILQSMVENGVKKVVFLSVQGVEKSSVIPHHKIEQLIVASGLDYIFVRPSYFMQNLSTTFLNEIRTKKSITVPAGNGIFNWVDVDNIGEATAHMILKFDQFKNKGYDLTGNENKTFGEACAELTKFTGTEIKFISPSLLRFFRMKRKEGMAFGFILVMTLLHYLPRFQKSPFISKHIRNITGKEPTALAGFFLRENSLFTE